MSIMSTTFMFDGRFYVCALSTVPLGLFTARMLHATIEPAAVAPPSRASSTASTLHISPTARFTPDNSVLIDHQRINFSNDPFSEKLRMFLSSPNTVSSSEPEQQGSPNNVAKSYLMALEELQAAVVRCHVRFQGHGLVPVSLRTPKRKVVEVYEQQETKNALQWARIRSKLQSVRYPGSGCCEMARAYRQRGIRRASCSATCWSGWRP